MRLPKYAIFDLTAGRAEDYPISEKYYRDYIGGKCLGARLLLDLMPENTDALAPEAVMIINTSPLNGTGAPSTSRYNMSFKNVMTGGVASSSCGGRFGAMLRRAGYDGIILRGRAEKPVTLEIIDGEFSIADASRLWGMDAEEVQEHLPKHYGKIVIGPAGENLVRYAGALSGERISGRCGTGAVLGSKNIKAIVAYGTQKPYVAEPEKFTKHVEKWVKFLRKHPMTGESLPRYGSAGLVGKANASGALPTHNFKYGRFADADKVSGETMAETELTRNSGCVSCPIRCERRVRVRGKEVKGPEYETLGFFGPNIDSSDLKKVLELNYTADILGLDTISLASSIAFAMELYEAGLADFGVRFGKADNLPEVVEKIARREGIYSELANGTKWLSEKYGGKEFAMHSKGLEMASYEPRRSVGMGLGYATSNRGGCHLNGGYMALLESVGVLTMDPQTPKAKSEMTAFMQNALEAVSSAGCCLFSAQSLVPAVFFRLGPAHPVTRATGKIMKLAGGPVRALMACSKLLRFNSMFLFPHAKAVSLAAGVPMDTGRFLLMGERSYNLERLFNLREGITSADDTLPDRLTRTPQVEGRPDTVVPLAKLLPRYYRSRGWTPDGVPSAKKLRALGIET